MTTRLEAQQAVRAWLATTTGLTAVVEPWDGDRPALPYVGVTVRSEVPIGNPVQYQTTTVVSEAVRYQTQGYFAVAYEVDVYCGGTPADIASGYGAVEAIAMGWQLTQATAGQTLTAAGVWPTLAGDIVDVSRFIDTAHERRLNLTLRANVGKDSGAADVASADTIAIQVSAGTTTSTGSEDLP